MTKFGLTIPFCFIVAWGCTLSDRHELATETPAVSVPVVESEAPAPIFQAATEKETPSAPPRSLTAEDISLLQTRLRELGFDPGPVDGVAGARTKAAFVRLHTGCMKLDMQAFANGAAVKLSRNETLKLQGRLRSAGFDPGPVDGIYGSRTKAVVTQLQNGCQMAKEFDVMLDHSSMTANRDAPSPESLAAPVSKPKSQSSNMAAREETPKPVAATQPAPSQEEIRILQLRLRDAGFDPGPFDGVMGPKTKAALEQYEASQRGRKTKASLTTRSISDQH